MKSEEKISEVNEGEVIEPKSEKADNTLLMVICTIILLALGFYANKKLMATKPEAKKAEVEAWTPSVRVVETKLMSYTPEIGSEGMVTASTKTMLISEVTGGLVYISPDLKKGNVILEGEILIKIDDADYQTQLTTAKSTLADAELMLAQEEARATQAEREWKKLGRGGSASDLVLRKPQIKSAKARIESAEATIIKIERDVSKTVIRAPYTCMVNEKFIDSGAFVSNLSRIVEVSSIDKHKVRLPIDLNELGFLDDNSGIGSEILLESNIGGKSYLWKGTAVRFEGGVDSNTFSRIMVVIVERDESKQKGFELPPVGLFLKGKLAGKPMGEVFAIPREALREGDTLWCLNEDMTLNIVDVNIVRTERDVVMVDAKSLSDGAHIIISPIAIPVDGMNLKLESEAAKDKEPDQDKLDPVKSNSQKPVTQTT